MVAGDILFFLTREWWLDFGEKRARERDFANEVLGILPSDSHEKLTRINTAEDLRTELECGILPMCLD